MSRIHEHNETLKMLRVRPCDDQALPGKGHDPRSAYVERFWVAVLGPSVVWLLRLLAREFDELSAGEELMLDLETTAHRLGLQHRGGHGSTLMRTIERCKQFELARLEPDGALTVRRRLPSVPRRLHRRMPPRLRSEVDAWGFSDGSVGVTGSRGLTTTVGLPSERGLGVGHAPEAELAAFSSSFSVGETRLLATCMLMLGHGLHESAERLVMLGLKPRAANEATAWAWAERCSRPLTRLPL